MTNAQEKRVKRIAEHKGFRLEKVGHGVFVFRMRERFDTVDVSALDRFRGEQRDTP